jgi:soluble lytic murein transglycosylase-like protein
VAGPGRSQLHVIRRVLLLVCLFVVAVPAPLFANAFGQPFRITHNATPEAEPTTSVAPLEVDSGLKIPAGPAIDEGSSGENVRSRSDRAGSDRIPEIPELAVTVTPDPNKVPRLNDPVLRWLPEIMASSRKWGVPPEILAGVIRIESQGEPGPISPAGARGLVQMMPDGLLNYGAAESMWHDPVTNIDAGAWGLAWRFNAQGSWEGAVGAYLGFGCDVYGTCTDVYVRVVMGWAAYYRPIIADPYNAGIPLLPDGWSYGPIRIFQMPTPPRPEEPPSSPTPTPTASASGTADTEPTDTPGPGEPTSVPTEPIGPTPQPTIAQPTTAPPTEVPTLAPPTQIPTVAPPPTEPPPPPTEPPVEE